MKKILIFLALALTIAIQTISQTRIDTNYATRAVSAVWIPDGKSILIAVVKYHKTNRQAPFISKVFNYELNSKKLIPLFDNGSNLTPSPDGKTIALLKRDDNKRADIYFYDIKTNNETVLKTDILSKNALSWSPDGKYLLYNISSKGTGQNATIDICVLDISTKTVRQITQSGNYKSYDPNWSPDSKQIVYYLEKGDGHDQIWLTDLNGSFHTNLTNDTTTHNYFPSWFDEKTILYTKDPETIMLMNTDGSNKRKIEGITSYHVKYNPTAGKFLFVNAETNNNVVLYDLKTKTETIILDGEKLLENFD